jgi:hypothetical protein
VFQQVPLRFRPGLYANRSARSSEQRWVDGNLVRFRDAMPEQMGGWREVPLSGDAIAGIPRAMICWRPASQLGRYAGIGTHLGFFLAAGSDVSDISPDDFAPGRAHTIEGAGYGALGYGEGLYGTRRITGTSLLDAGIWTVDMYGSLLVACFNADGIIYTFDVETDTALQELTAIQARAICVSEERHLFAFGVGDDPTLVLWSDREYITDFTPTSTNRAGGFNVAATSLFQCGARVRGYVLAWTATEIFGFFPLNNSLVYAHERLGTNCGACGPQATVIVTDDTSETAYWMGPTGFYAFEGSVRELECELRDYVFNNINLVQRAKFQAKTNSEFQEVWFFYCSASSLEIDRAVILNYGTGTWTKATISRTAWLDTSVWQRPLAMTADGRMWEHEVGETANGAPMGSFVTSHPNTVGIGHQLAELDAFWPDMQPGSARCSVTFVGKDYPGGPNINFGPYPFLETDEKIDLAIAVRQFSVRVDGLDGYWELGTPLLSMQGGSLR